MFLNLHKEFIITVYNVPYNIEFSESFKILAVFATGARDGFIMIWDIRANHSDQPKPDNCIANAHSIGGMGSTRRKPHTQTSRAQSITGLVFQDDFTLISCAAGDG